MNKKSGLADSPLFINPIKPPSDAQKPPVATVYQSATPSIVPQHSESSVGERPNGRTPEQVNTRTGERPNTRTPARANRRTPERPIVRMSYNVFEDQHADLQRIEAESMLSGKALSKSDLVRQALDQFLKRYK